MPKSPSSEGPHLPGLNRAGDAPPFQVVCVGASAGGIEAFRELLASLPPDTGMAFVFLLHMPAQHPSMLASLLARDTRIPVVEAAEGITLEPDHIFIMPGGTPLVLSQGNFVKPAAETGNSPPIDQFMRSLAEEQMHMAIGIVLSGTANDGSRGVEEIKGGGGITFAQDDSAQHNGMPRSATATGAVDFVLPPREIAQELSRIAKHPYIGDTPKLVNDSAFERIIEVIHQATGVDFSRYKRNTLHRRITRRMVLHKMGGAADYLRFLQSSKAEAHALYEDVLIGVTSFFRNPEAYEALKESVFPKLTQDRGRNDPVRVWALGCSTGEEAYSLAIAFTEYTEANGVHVPLQVFATDLNASGVEKARTGMYARGIAQDVSPERLRRFFVEVDGAYRICKPIRDMCVFARQNVLSDPPFSRIDLVACRNLLIYMDPMLQQRVIPLLHYALRRDGFLWLGGSETVGSYRDLFDVVDAKNKIYRKRSVGRAPVNVLPAGSVPPVLATNGPAAAVPAAIDPHKEADRVVLARYGPPGVVLDADLEIVQFRGDTSPYLSPAPGKASLSLLKMLREGLMVAVRNAIQKARRDNAPVREEGLRVRSNGGWREVDVSVLPMRSGDAHGPALLVLFEETSAHLSARLRQREAEAHALEHTAAGPAEPGSATRENERLRQELAATRDYLQSVIEQQEAANEELQSANEEIQSSNEEIQSINEELETSKEEIQSSNEELATVNEELQNRNLELSQINNDLTNLLASVQMAIVMVGPDLRIRRFTPAAEKLLNLIAADVGRPLGDIKLRLRVDDLEARVAEVIDSVATREQDVQDNSGRWYSLRVRPYRTLENKIDGAVIMLVDIDELKKAEASLREGDRAKDQFLAMLAHELRNPLAGVRSAAQLLLASRDESTLQEAARIIDRQTSQMVRMVDELLDLSRMRHGKVRLRAERVELGEVLRASIATTARERAVFSQAFEADLPGGALWVEGDAMRLDQVFTNLLHNASKFTPRGGHIGLAVRAKDYSAIAQAGEIEVRISDDGRGIEPELLPHVFDLFVQGGRPAGGDGLGLGLALARQIVELHGGAIEAHSAGAGRGSEFVVRLPSRPAGARADAGRRAKPGKARTPRNVLIVDDNEDAAQALRLLLETQGHKVRVVHEGTAALPAAIEFHPDVILLDLGLPDADGLEVARQLRTHEAATRATLVAVTGYGRQEDLHRSREVGIDEHFTKPVDTEALLDLLENARPRP